jgi:hypothetical protein
MAKIVSSDKSHESLHKRTSQGGRIPKTSTMNKNKKSCFKRYRGQGK